MSWLEFSLPSFILKLPIKEMLEEVISHYPEVVIFNELGNNDSYFIS